MDTINKFYQTLTKEDFAKMPLSLQHLFYEMAISCNCSHELCKRVLQFYKYLTLEAGIYGRKELIKGLNIFAAQKIPENIKAQLKTQCILQLISKFNVNTNSVYFYDDCPLIIEISQNLGIHSICVQSTNGLQLNHLLEIIRKKLREPNSVNLILIDFDKTFSVHRYKKKYQKYPINEVIERHFGGSYRIKLLFESLKKLEILGVKIGFISFHTKTVLIKLLKDIDWINEYIEQLQIL